MHEIKGSHVIGLAETHIHDGIMDDLRMSGDKFFSHKNGKNNLKSNLKSNTALGGFAIFILKVS